MVNKTIVNFFNKKSFSENDLVGLKKLIIEEVGYKNFKPFENIINLHLLKFKIDSAKSKKTKESKQLKKSQQENKSFKNKIKASHSFVGISVRCLSEKLNIKVGFTISALKTRGFNVSENDLLNKEMCESIYPYINKRLQIINKPIKSKSSISLPPTKGRGKEFSNSVYDKIQLNQGVGKLIYIRRK